MVIGRHPAKFAASDQRGVRPQVSGPKRSNRAGRAGADDNDVRYLTVLPLSIATPERRRPPKAQTVRNRAAAVRKRPRMLPVPRRSSGVREKSLLRRASERGSALGHASAFWSRQSRRADASPPSGQPRAPSAAPLLRATPYWLDRGSPPVAPRGLRRDRTWQRRRRGQCAPAIADLMQPQASARG